MYYKKPRAHSLLDNTKLSPATFCFKSPLIEVSSFHLDSCGNLSVFFYPPQIPAPSLGCRAPYSPYRSHPAHHPNYIHGFTPDSHPYTLLAAPNCPLIGWIERDEARRYVFRGSAPQTARLAACVQDQPACQFLSLGPVHSHTACCLLARKGLYGLLLHR